MTWIMYDSVDVNQIPDKAHAVAGYIDGHFANYPDLREQFPHAHVLPIAVTAHDKAHCLDIEKGDATPEEAAKWVHERHAEGLDLPALYASLSMWPAIMHNLSMHGIRRERIRAWVAHYTDHPHICHPSLCGPDAACLKIIRPHHHLFSYADGTQWTNHAHGRNLDESLLHEWFFPPLAHV